MGLSWKKARKLLALASPQQRRCFLQDFQRLVAQAHQGRILLVFCDEAHLHLDADLGYGWAQRGRPFWVHSCSPGLQKYSFYGLYLFNYQAVRISPGLVTMIHLICDNVSVHHGKLVRAWLKKHPRFRMHFTPVHCSWMNQVEQWFSIVQRKRLSAPNFADLNELESKLLAFIEEWNRQAHPFKWKRKSFDKTLSKIERDRSIQAAAA